MVPSGYDIASSPWEDPPILRTVNHLFLWAIFHGYVSHNQRVTLLVEHNQDDLPVWSFLVMAFIIQLFFYVNSCQKLVGGIPTPPKNISSSVGMDIPNNGKS